MANPPNDYNTDINFNKFKGTYFNDDIDVSGGDIINRTGNLYLADNSNIYTSTNQIQFDDTYSFTNFLNSVNISGQLKLTYNSTEYDVGYQLTRIQDIYDNKIGTMFYNSTYDFNEFNNIYCAGQIQYEDSNGAHVDLVPIVLSNQTGLSTANDNVLTLQSKTTNISYNSGTNTTTITGLLTLPLNSINSTAINNSTFLALTGNQTITSGIKTFSTAPVLSGASITAGTIPVTAVSGSAVNLNTAQTITATKLFSVVQNFSSNIRLDGSLLVGTLGNVILNNTTLQKIAFISTISSDIQTQLNTTNSNVTTLTNNSVSLSALNTFSGATNTFTNNIRLDSSLLLNAGAITITNANLQKLQYISTISSDIQTQVTNLSTSSVSLSALNSFSGATNTFTNNIRLDGSLLLNAGANTITNATLQKLQYISTISSDIQIQTTTNATNIGESKDKITTLTTKNTDISYTAGTTTTTIANNLVFTGTLNNIIPAVFSYLSNLSGNIQDQLNTSAIKLSAISYTAGTTTTTITNTLASSTLTFSGTLNNINTTTFGYLSGVTSSIQAQINNFSGVSLSANNSFTGSNTFADITFTGTLNNISNTVYGYLSGVSSNIQSQLDSKIDNVQGTVIQHVSSNLQTFFPSRFLLCNGQAVSRTTYSVLFVLIGTTYGSGDGSTTFNIPDYRACFLRMYSSARTVNGVVYTPNTPNTIQQDSLEEHEHDSGLSGNYLRSGTNTNMGYTSGFIKPNQSDFPAYTGGVTPTNRTSIETRPLNHSIYFYIIC